MPRAAILAIGSELLTPSRVDTNSLLITESLNVLGIEVVFKGIVGDDPDEVARLLRFALERADLIVCSGGLGPTEDDVTREAVAAVTGRSLREDQAVVDRLRARFASRGVSMPENNRRQAMVPEGALAVENVVGSAPGIWLEVSGQVIVLLPGPPRELRPMLEALIAGPLATRASGRSLVRRVVRITGRFESHVDETMQDLYRSWAASDVPVHATILAVMGQIELHLTATASTAAAADAALAGAVTDVEARLGSDVYSTDGSPLEAVVGDTLAQRGLRIAVAESCTGGLVTSRLTDVPGSSRYVLEAVVAYANDAKIEALGVPRPTLDAYGAVSDATARAMAEGIRARAGSDIGIGVTGIAGPGGGSAEKPVGTVVVAVAGLGDTRVRTFRFPGDRALIKAQAAQAALDLVRRSLLEP